MQPTDSELMASVARGDREAFATLVERHKRAVTAYMGRLTGNRDRAEELAQETFVRLFQAAAGYRDQGRLVPYLFRIGTNLLRSEERRQRPWARARGARRRGGRAARRAAAPRAAGAGAAALPLPRAAGALRARGVELCRHRRRPGVPGGHREVAHPSRARPPARGARAVLGGGRAMSRRPASGPANAPANPPADPPANEERLREALRA